MGRRLSRLEREYVLASAGPAPVLEVFRCPESFRPEAAAGPDLRHFPAVLCPASSVRDGLSGRIFLPQDFLAAHGFTAGCKCCFCFRFRSRRVFFLSRLEPADGGASALAGDLFYAADVPGTVRPSRRADDAEAGAESVPEAAGSLVFSGRTLYLAADSAFPLRTADRKKRLRAFLYAVPENLPDREPGARFRETGALFYLDHKTALAAFSSGYLRAAFPEEDFPQMLTGSLHLAFAARRLVLPCSIRFSFGKAGEDSVRPRLKIPAGLALCRLDFTAPVPEDVRFLYELSRGRKYR